MAGPASPPIQLEGVVDDLSRVEALYAACAPYTPLGGWFRPDQEGDEARSAMWFQGDWLHADFAAPGVELFSEHPRYLEAARAFSGCEVVEPHTVYVNLMAAIAESGPAHTDNPIFRGRDRTNTPMMLLRTMLWSGLFTRWEVPQVTAIWWMNDVEGGGFSYWPDGPGRPAHRHHGAMANTAIVGDNHHMFHQVEPVGPFDEGTRLVAASAELAPAGDGSGDWVVTHGGEERYRAPFSTWRASVLWKANVYPTEAERRRVADDLLSLEEVARRFDEDLSRRGEAMRFDPDRIEDPAFAVELGAAYPEATPLGAGRSIFDAA